MNSVRPRVVSSVAANSESPTSAITIVLSSSCSSSRSISRVIVIGASGCSANGSLFQSVGAGGRGCLPLSLRCESSRDEIFELHVVIVMMPNAQLLAGDVDAVADVELGRVDAEVDVGHERAEHQHAVARFDVLGDFLAAQRAFVQAHVERMRLGDDALAEHRGGHRESATPRPA